jgi:hypothetical protein
MRLADGYRRYAETLPAPTQQRWFLGHWGLQYYLEKTGAKPVDLSRTDLLINRDELIIPKYAVPQILPDRIRTTGIASTDIGGRIVLRTVTLPGWACFYGSVITPGPTIVGLPYGLDHGPIETIKRASIAR